MKLLETQHPLRTPMVQTAPLRWQDCTKIHMTNGEARAAADGQGPLDEAMSFFRDIVEPTVAEFIEQPHDRRRGCLACLCIASMADHYFHARPEFREGFVDANAFRGHVGRLNGAVKHIIDVANAIKHFERRHKRVGYQDVSAQQIDSDNMRCDWPIEGKQVMVETHHSNTWLLADLVEAAAAFCRDLLTT